MTTSAPLSPARDVKELRPLQWLLIIYVTPWIFNIRAAQGSSLLVLQLSILFTSLSAFAGMLVMLKSPRVFRICRESISGVVAVGLFTIVSTASGVIYHNEFSFVITNILPPFMFVSSVIVISIFAEAKEDMKQAFAIVMVISAIAIVLRAFIGFAYFNLTFETARYQILSESIVIGSAYFVACFVSRFRAIDVVLSVITLLIIFISATRANLLVIVVMGAFLMYARTKTFGLKQGTGTARTIVGVSVFALVVIALASLLPANPIERTAARFLNPMAMGADFSALERQANILFQIEGFFKGGLPMFIGHGIAAPGGVDSVYAQAILRYLNYIYVPVGFADNTYASVLYLGGLLGGGPILVIQFIWVRQAFLAIRYVFLSRFTSARWLIAAPLATVGYQTMGFFQGWPADRSICVFYGLCVGFMGWMIANYRREMAASKLSTFDH